MTNLDGLLRLRMNNSPLGCSAEFGRPAPTIRLAINSRRCSVKVCNNGHYSPI